MFIFFNAFLYIMAFVAEKWKSKTNGSLCMKLVKEPSQVFESWKVA